jgi:hypothetical protein
MTMTHPDAPTLLAFLAGEQEAPDLQAHLLGCQICRTRLGDERRLIALLRAKPKVRQDAHLSAETLAAYLDQTLAVRSVYATGVYATGFLDAETQRVEQHVLTCDRCLSRFLDLRRMLELEATHEPQRAVAAKALEAFVPRVKSLGRIAFRELFARLAGRFLPSPAYEDLMGAEMIFNLKLDNLELERRRTEDSDRHTGLDLLRPDLAPEEITDLVQQERESREASAEVLNRASELWRREATANPDFRTRAEQAELRAKHARGKLHDLEDEVLEKLGISESIVFRFESTLWSIRGRKSPEGYSLELEAREQKTGQPAAGVALTFNPEHALNECITAITDSSGQARLSVPELAGRLTIAGQAEVVLTAEAG